MRPPLAYLEGRYSSSCGYCKHSIHNYTDGEKHDASSSQNGEEKKRWSYGIDAYNVPPALYDSLLQKNWRRCGSLYYCPLNETMCCPQYAIRVPASKFSTCQRSTHRRVFKKFSKFLLQPSNADAPLNDKSLDLTCNTEKLAETDRIPVDLFEKMALAILKVVYSHVATDRHLLVSPDKIHVKPLFDQQKASDKTGNVRKFHKLSCNVALYITGIMKRFKDYKLSAKDLALRILESHEVYGGSIVKTEVCESGLIVFHLDKEYCCEDDSDKTMNDPPTKLKPTEKQPNRRLFLVCEPSALKEDEFNLYSQYQQQIHGDLPSKITKHGYSDFLCQSSLYSGELDPHEFEIEVGARVDSNDFEFQSTNSSKWFSQGSYHIRYELRTGDKVELIAVSVVDVLPTGLSSVYFLYDPKFAHLSPGVLSALIEISLVKWNLSLRNNHAIIESYYYLGYYIHECSKMRYKSQFKPSDILCPVTRCWTSLDSRVEKLLDQEKYCHLKPFDKEEGAMQQHLTAEINLESMKFLVRKRYLVDGKSLVQQAKFTESFLEHLREFRFLATESICSEFAFILLDDHDIIYDVRK